MEDMERVLMASCVQTATDVKAAPSDHLPAGMTRIVFGDFLLCIKVFNEEFSVKMKYLLYFLFNHISVSSMQ